MKIFAKVLIFLSFFLGIPIVFLGMTDLLSPDVSSQDKEGALAAIAIFGVPSNTLGMWLIWNLYRDKRRISKIFDLKLEQKFLSLLVESEGRVSVVDFALSSHLTIEEAKHYLGQKAKELNADFEVSDAGNILYIFSV